MSITIFAGDPGHFCGLLCKLQKFRDVEMMDFGMWQRQIIHLPGLTGDPKIKHLHPGLDPGSQAEAVIFHKRSKIPAGDPGYFMTITIFAGDPGHFFFQKKFRDDEASNSGLR